MRIRHGFTLVELLLVIIIIGAIAGMMMISAGSATDKTEETRCISDRRAIKSALGLYRAEHGSYGGYQNQITKMFDNLDVKNITGDTMTDICPSHGMYTIISNDEKLEIYCSVHSQMETEKIAKTTLILLNEALSDKTSDFYKYLLDGNGRSTAAFDSEAVNIESGNGLAGMSNKLKNLLAARGMDVTTLKSWQVKYNKSLDSKFSIYYSNTAINNNSDQKIEVTKLDSDGTLSKGTVSVKLNEIKKDGKVIYSYYIYDKFTAYKS